jgi:hypothetical protein
MEFVTIVISAATLAYFSYMLGKDSTSGNVLTLKRENERLNKELLKMGTRHMNRKLYTHDAKGRFRRINNNAETSVDA